MKPTSAKRPIGAVSSVPRVFAPGAEWRYFKFYAAPAMADRLLAEVLAPLAALHEEVAAGEMLVGLHGNARRGLARGMRREVDRMAAEVNLVIDRVAAAADAIEGAAAPAPEPGA